MTNQENPIKYFLYARKSTEAEDRQVASINDQIREMNKIAKERGFNIVQVFQESMSAKNLGRPIFNEMLEQIKQGKANGVICWKADRLARNMVDGGVLIDLLSKGIIEHIQTYDSEYRTADNVIVLSVAFGCSTQYSKDLAVNVKRGIDSKAQKGWFPNHAPLGYLNYRGDNGKGEAIIIKDYSNFLLVKKLFNIMLNEKCSLNTIAEKANKLGLKTNKGYKMYANAIRYIFKNPFYYGKFEHPVGSGNWYHGKHEPMITFEEHQIIQAIITRKLKSKQGFKTHKITYKGIFTCECCNGAITGSKVFKHQKNGNKHEYTYYHCAKSKDKNCNQKSQPLNEKELEKQINQTIDKIDISEEIFTWAINELDREKQEDTDNQKEIIKGYQNNLTKEQTRLNRLIDMRLNDEIAKKDYLKKREIIEKDISNYQSLIKNQESKKEEVKEKTIKAFEFTANLKERFKKGDDNIKKAITLNLGSNHSIINKKAHFCLDLPLKPFEKYAPKVKEEIAMFKPVEIGLNTGLSASYSTACSVPSTG